MEIIALIDLLFKLDLMLMTMTVLPLIRFLRMRHKVKPLSTSKLIQIVGGFVLPFYNFGLFRILLNANDPTFQVGTAILKICNEIDAFLAAQDEAGLLTMTAISDNDAIYFLIDRKKYIKLKHNIILNEFCKYIGVYLRRLGYRDIFFNIKGDNIYLGIHVRSKSSVPIE